MKILSINPADGTQLASFEESTAEEVQKVVAKAHRVQAEWSSLAKSERKEKFLNLAQILEEQMTDIVSLIQKETGKIAADGEGEVWDVIDAIKYHLRIADGLSESEALELNPEAFPETSLELRSMPYGVIGLIMPWNFPLYVPMILAAVVTMAGNAVVIKPSEHSTMVGQKIVSLFNEAGFPESLVQIVVGADDVGRSLVDSDVEKLFFVGSVEAAEEIIARAGTKPVEFEAGGNSAALVLADADITVAANAVAWGGSNHSGQDCVGVKRVFVHEDIADEFIAEVVKIVGGLRPGADHGPYISRQARNEVKRRIDAAVADGAELLVGGEIDESSQGNWLSASVLLLNDSSSELVAKETFGNAIPIQIVTSVDEAIEKSNASSYGLSTAVFTQDTDSVTAIADRLQSGMVYINDSFVTNVGWDHWIGWKKSGNGAPKPRLGQCLKAQVVSVNKSKKPRDFWYPY